MNNKSYILFLAVFVSALLVGQNTISGFDLLYSSDGSTYYLSDEPATWSDANQECVNQGGHLVAINSQEEQGVLFESVMAINMSSFWIGLNDINSEGNFVWTNGDVFEYENWNTQNVNDPEPNGFNNSPSFQEDVVEVQSGQNNPQNAGFWNDAPEDSNRLYVLEMSSFDCDSDITPPVITIVGGEELVFFAGNEDSYTDPGAACVDDVDGFISQNVEVSGDVPNLSIPGTYSIVYECSDACGNTSEATRTVIVHDQVCDVFVTPVVSNLCDGNWLVYFDFTYESEFPGLDDVAPLFTASSGDIVNFEETTVEFNSLYDCAFVIDSPGLYNVSFLTNTDCTFGEYQIDIPEQIDVSVNAEINNPDCFGDLGNYAGSLDGPSGIYQIYLNNESYGSVSIGLENIEFDTWTGNDAVDCEGNNLSAEPGSSFVIALNQISGLNLGDQIGAFFLHPSCGLFNAGSAVYEGTNTVVSIWADDTGTSEIEGFTPGQNIIWLVNSVSDGLIYNANITWDESMYPSGDFFIPNGLASTASINIGDTYEDSFSIDLPSGLYDVTVQDGDCVLFEENDVEIITPLSINDITIDVADNVCATYNEGVININGLSPDSDYAFGLNFLNDPSLFFEAENTTFNDLPSGIYSLAISDLSCGEDVLLPVFINSPIEIEVTAVFSDYNGYGVLCNGASDGFIDITVEGGTGDYTYLWSNNFNSEDISALGAGLYSVIVTDENGCFSAYPVDITEPDEITINADISNYNGYGVSCNGGSDGFIDITVEGGSGEYFYDWDAWTGTEDLDNLEAGNYEITVEDSEGCQAVAQFSISEPDELESSIDVVNVSCFGNLGSATLLMSGGSGAYSLNGFNFGSEGIFIGSLEPDNYTFLVSDDDGCNVEVSFVIEGPTEPLNVTTSVVDVICPGDLGSVNFNISGGTPPYYYDSQLVSEDSFTSNDLSPGDYSVVITDSLGCPTLVEFEIIQSIEELDLLFSISPDCYDSSSSDQPQGALSMTFSGGSPPYIVTMNGELDSNIYFSEDDTAFYNNLSSGIYDFIVLDGNFCEFSASQEIVSNTPIDVSYFGQPYNCSDEPDAFFSINITGGLSPYNYSWTDGVSSIDGTSETGVLELNNLETGSYFLYIEDSLGCNASSFLGVPISLDSLFNIPQGPSFIMDVSQVEPLDIDYDFTQPLVCFEDTLSSLSFSISQTGDFISNNFNLFIDSSGVIIDSLLITPGSISLDFCFPALNNGISQSIVSSENGNSVDSDLDGIADVFFPPFNTNMLEGDVFGFFNLVNPSLLESGYQCVGGIQGGDSNCGSNSAFVAPLAYSDAAFNNGNLSFITWFEESLSPNLGILSSSNSNFISNTPVGFVNRDGLIYGCQIEFFTTSDIPGSPFVDTYIPNTFMYVSSIIVDPEPFTGSDGQSVISILNPSYNDSYEFTIVDQFGCSQIIEIDFPAPQENLTASMSITNDLSCITASDATLSVLPSGGYGDYDIYLYNCEPLSADCENVELIDSITSIVSCPFLVNECNTYNFNNLPSGEYYVSIVDSLGCVRYSNVESISPPFPIDLNYDISDYNGFGVSCNGGSDGSINLTVSGGSGNYSYTWFQNTVELITTSNPDLLNIEAGLYNVVITDDNDCESETYEILITEPSEIAFEAIIDPILCYSDTGDITLSWSGGVPFETGGEYQFIQPTGVDPNGVNTEITIANSAIGPNGSNGYFAEIAVDANGCQVLFEVYMTEPDQIQLLGDVNEYISDYNGFSTSCSNANDGQIGIDVPLDVVGGIGQYSFEWYLNLGPNNESQLINAGDFGSSLTSLDGIPAGIYELIISDESGVECSSESYIFNLTQPDIIGVSPSSNQLIMFSDYDGDGQEDVWLQELLYNDVDATLSIYGDYGVSCYGANNGFINIFVEGGVGNYIYQWEADTNGDGINDFFSNSENLYNLYPGVYSITVTDENYDFNNFENCTLTQTYILEEPSESVQADFFVSNFDNSINNVNVVPYEYDNILDYGVSCFGASDGFIYLENLVGGTGTYNYTLNAIDDNNDNVLVSSGNVSDMSIIDGYYVLSGLQAGTYMLSVFDSNYEFLADEWDTFSSSINYQGCFLEVSIILTEPNEIILSETHSTYYSTGEFEGYGVSCFGASDGSIIANAIGGDGVGLPLNYVYSWYGVVPGGNFIDPDDYIDLNGQENSPELNGIPAGTYVVTVYDERDCSQTLVVEILSPPNIDFIINQPTDYNNNVCFDISCYGANDGFINSQSLNEDAGEGFSYTWTYNDDTLSVTDANIGDLSPGYYQLIVQDNLTNCEKTFGPVFISEPSVLYTSIDNISISDFDGTLGDNDYNGYSVSCSDASDGIISVEVEGGSGVYSVTVLDSFGEIVTESTASLFPQPCEIDVLVDIDIDNDGILNQDDIDIDGDGLSNVNDDLPYYPGSMSTVIDLNSLSAGNYSVVISDAYCPLIDDCGCSSIEINNIELTAPPEILEAEIIQLDSVSCFGLSDGAVSAEFSGGLPDNWNWGLYSLVDEGDILLDTGVNLAETGQINIDNLSAGIYRLDIYDINGFYVNNTSFSNLGLGAPEESLFFNQGCFVSLPFEINQPLLIDTTNLNITSPCFIYEDNLDSLIVPEDGVIAMEIIGGVSPFNIFINDDFIGSYGSNLEIAGLSLGNYTLSVFDVNNCSSSFDIEITSNMDAPSQVFVNNIDIDQDGVFDHIRLPDCEFSLDGFISVPEITSDIGPAFSYTYFWGIDLDFDGQYDYTSLDDMLLDVAIGIYSLNITDNVSGCTFVYDYHIEEALDCYEVPTAFSPNGDGVNDYWVIGGMDEYTDAEVEIYNRWGQLVFYTPDNSIYWDGVYNGKNMPTADYFFIIKNSDGDVLKHGRLTLRR